MCTYTNIQTNIHIHKLVSVSYTNIPSVVIIITNIAALFIIRRYNNPLFTAREALSVAPYV